MPSRSKIAPELGKTAVQSSRVERREICSDMGIHAREPITNQLNGKGQNADFPDHSFHGELFLPELEAPCSRQHGYRRTWGKDWSHGLNRIRPAGSGGLRPSRIKSSPKRSGGVFHRPIRIRLKKLLGRIFPGAFKRPDTAGLELLNLLKSHDMLNLARHLIGAFFRKGKLLP